MFFHGKIASIKGGDNNLEELYIKGVLETIYFQNDANYYKVLLITIEETNTDLVADQIVVTGTFGQMHQDTMYTFFGKVIEHAKYGVQFQCDRYEQDKVTSKKGLIYYLSSDRFSGIGTVLATRIVDVLGENALELITQDSALLKTIQGLTTKKRELLIEQVRQDHGENQTLLELLAYGFTDKESFKIYQVYQEKAKVVIDNNPYALLQKIEGISFYKIDQLALTLKFETNATERLQGALMYVLKELSFRQGHTYFSAKEVILAAIAVLEKSHKELVDEQLISKALVDSTLTGEIIEDNQCIALPSLYYAEQGIASRLKALSKQEKSDYPVKKLEKIIQNVQKQYHVTYASEQIQAIEQALLCPVSIITGGPGTGKTTVLKGIVESFAQLNDINLSMVNEYNCPILLAAPTGRAAKRMSELIGLKATTLHRLLGIGLTGEAIQLTEDSTLSTLEGMLLIVDEMSMVDTWLMNWLLKAIPMGMQVVFVGDKDQLTSVGPGNVLKDILQSNQIPFTQLERVFRQDELSTITTLAHAINTGVLPADFSMQKKDRSFFECNTTQIPSLVEKVVTRAIEKGYTLQDIQVLVPLYKGVAGIDALNHIIQAAVNPPHSKKREIRYFDKVFRVGDKVLQQVNMPEKSVYNGDIGYVEAIMTDNQTQEMIIRFDEQLEVSYTANEFNQITLAYCCSIHKAQGSEFPLVILPMVSAYGRMLRRDLLYTAITRSKQSIVFCGEEQAFQVASKQVGEQRRTRLLEFLIEDPKQINVMYTTVKHDYKLTEENIWEIDPMIGMDNITPFDFL